jgi:hypothetical protein
MTAHLEKTVDAFRNDSLLNFEPLARLLGRLASCFTVLLQPAMTLPAAFAASVRLIVDVIQGSAGFSTNPAEVQGRLTDGLALRWLSIACILLRGALKVGPGSIEKTHITSRIISGNFMWIRGSSPAQVSLDSGLNLHVHSTYCSHRTTISLAPNAHPISQT